MSQSFIRKCYGQTRASHYWDMATGKTAPDPAGHTFTEELRCPRHGGTKMPKVNINSRSTLPVYTAEELTLLAARIGLTLEQLKRYGDAAYSTYSAIAADLADATGGKAMKRYDVVEVTLDADHISMYGRMEADLIEWRKTRHTLNYKLEDYYGAVAAVAFPFSEYQ